ncbi:MAG: hypothetical protein JRH01_24655 [Deltaproteobacteria bacterium]|nr:hypothetical protein [Deltaproteobacteria bacterium]
MEQETTKSAMPGGRSPWMHLVLVCLFASILPQAGSATPLVYEDLDFGDAPSPIYPTLLAEDGARHMIGPGLWLGDVIDAEFDGLPSPLADGDDLHGIPDDEDGILFVSPLIPGATAEISVSASGHGFVNAWIDFAGDGDWHDAGDNIFADVPLVPGVSVLSISVPTSAVIGTTYARFRLNSYGGLSATGLAFDGEVEDYQVSIVPEPRTAPLVGLGLLVLAAAGSSRQLWRARIDGQLPGG